jgi:hypothetical protein
MKTDKIRAEASAATTTNAPPTTIIEKDWRLQSITYFGHPSIDTSPLNFMNEISLALSNMDGRGKYLLINLPPPPTNKMIIFRLVMHFLVASLSSRFRNESFRL